MRLSWKNTILFITMILAVSACSNPSGTAVTTEHMSQQKSGKPEESEVSGGKEEPGKTEAEESETQREVKEARETNDTEENSLESTGPRQGEESTETSLDKKLTLEKVLELSGKEDISWEDFKEYSSQDVGFGTYILCYEVNEDFSLLIGAAGYEEPPMYIKLVSRHGDEDGVDIRTGDVEGFIREHRSTVRYTGIKGHIKEAHGDYALISSDTDEFPGVFRVSGVRELAKVGELKGGTPVFVLMEETEEKDDSGLPGYRAIQFSVLSEERAQADILLTDAPELVLTDVLSSLYNPFTVTPGNYGWDVEENGEMKGIVACGAEPLAEAGMKGAAKLKVPRYNHLDRVGYTCSTEIMPDKLTVFCWPARDIGESGAKAESIITYYYVPFILELEPKKVYEFAAEWDKEKMGQRRFAGRASYVVVTE